MPRRFGFTFVELMMATGIIGLALALFLPLITQSIDETRQLACANHMQRLGRGVLEYPTFHGRFPRGRGYPDWSVKGIPRTAYTNYSAVNLDDPTIATDFLSVFALILPFVDRDDVAALIVRRSNKQMTVGSDQPINPNYKAAFTAGKFFICPADSNSTRGGIAEGNYRVNFGGSTPYGGARSTVSQDDIDAKITDPVTRITYSSRGNGAFTIGQGYLQRQFPDGLSKTAFLSERTKGSGIDAASQKPTLAEIMTLEQRVDGLLPPHEFFLRCESSHHQISSFNFAAAGRWLPGSNWSSGWLFAGYDATQYNHVAPPNWQHFDCGGFSSIPDTPGEHAIIAARSMHPASVNVVFGDGRVEQVSDSIDLKVWRAMGARDDKQQRPQGGLSSG